jgi:microcompartment protein CcmL/EutN
LTRKTIGENPLDAVIPAASEETWPDPEVLRFAQDPDQARSRSGRLSGGKALGLIETVGLVAAIEAADAAVKSAQVKLLGYELTKGGGMVTIKLLGEVSAVKAAIDAGSAAALRIGKVVSVLVIPRPADDTELMIANVDSTGNQPPILSPSLHSSVNSAKDLWQGVRSEEANPLPQECAEPQGTPPGEAEQAAAVFLEEMPVRIAPAVPKAPAHKQKSPKKKDKGKATK